MLRRQMRPHVKTQDAIPPPRSLCPGSLFTEMVSLHTVTSSEPTLTESGVVPIPNLIFTERKQTGRSSELKIDLSISGSTEAIQRMSAYDAAHGGRASGDEEKRALPRECLSTPSVLRSSPRLAQDVLLHRRTLLGSPYLHSSSAPLPSAPSCHIATPSQARDNGKFVI